MCPPRVTMIRSRAQDERESSDELRLNILIYYGTRPARHSFTHICHAPSLKTRPGTARDRGCLAVRPFSAPPAAQGLLAIPG